ncbi:uncharacterized protein LOC142611926 [Castanea sativa]|uniref:uncharacterized protein LOC142611926 n=1 Tax=Castanea sativa TaxID=21020 RepID=UPI003F64FC41
MLLDKEAKMWAQQSKVLWLKDGDRNTRFFHSKASQPQRHNYITKLHDTLGRLCTRPSQINDIITTFYQELFTTGGPSSFEEVIDTIPQVVSPEMNAELIAVFTIDEVEAVIRQMLISEYQSTLMSDRLISDNILVAFETSHYLRNHNKGRTGFMASKFNMSKAYDRVKWSYMEKVLVKLGFQERWIKAHDGMHHHRLILNLDQWGTARPHHPYKRI